MPTDFKTSLASTAQAVERVLADCLLSHGHGQMNDPMRHAVLNGGKRLRAYLTVNSSAIFDVSPQAALQAAAAIECLHAYSLVHDDLPCMDDDDLRRGQPTVHVKWDDATAVLTGDALQTLAFELLAELPDVDPSNTVKLIAGLARASGMNGMVLGQAQDIAAETANTPLTIEEITALQGNKTGALIEWSATAGPTMAGADVAPLHLYAKFIGLAFQIQDDILDVEGDASLAGKRLQKDADAGKATFVSLLGMTEAKSRANDLVRQACDALATYGDRAEPMRQVAQFIINRNM
jgi:farnesyl diphosphate synthase